MEMARKNEGEWSGEVENRTRTTPNEVPAPMSQPGPRGRQGQHRGREQRGKEQSGV